MKKIYLLFCVFIAGTSAYAQGLIPGGDMENWRTGTAGTVAVQAPWGWYGLDSTIIAFAQPYSLLLGLSSSDWHPQIFEESTIVHSGSHSAKILSIKENSVLGMIPGVLSTAQANVSVNIATMTLNSFSYVGGTPMTQKPTTVSAWVEYFPGKDTNGVSAQDTGVMTVQAISHIAGIDSVIGTGTIRILPCTSWQQITDSIVYALDTTDNVDTLQITFTSSGGGTNPVLDSTTLYVDDVTMTWKTQTAVKNVVNSGDLVKVYPNPAAATLYFDAPQNIGLNYQLYAVNGAMVTSNKLNGNAALDVSALSDGLYFYTITDQTGNVVQRGKVSVVR